MICVCTIVRDAEWVRLRKPVFGGGIHAAVGALCACEEVPITHRKPGWRALSRRPPPALGLPLGNAWQRGRPRDENGHQKVSLFYGS
jgi:hypothetical protein